MFSRFSAAQPVSAARSMASMATAMLLLCGSSVWAGTIGPPPPGGSIDYGPVSSASVPTLSEWTLGLMGLLLAVIAYRALRGRVNGRLLSNLTLAGGAVAATAAGYGLIREAEATAGVTDLYMSAASGGNVSGTNWVRLNNTSGVPLKIKAIHRNGSSSIASPPPEEPECTVNAIVAPGAKCNVHFVYLE